MSASAGSKPIFGIKATEDNTKITTPMFSVSGKIIAYFVSLDVRASLKISSGGFASYSSTSGSGDFKFGSSKGGSEFAKFT